MLMSVLECDLLLRIKDAYQRDINIKKMIEELKKKPKRRKRYVWSMDILRRKKKIVIPNDDDIKR